MVRLKSFLIRVFRDPYNYNQLKLLGSIGERYANDQSTCQSWKDGFEEKDVSTRFDRIASEERGLHPCLHNHSKKPIPLFAKLRASG